jgi:hypothetical protein
VWALTNSDTAHLLYAFFNMFAWVGLAGYSFWAIYACYYLGRDQLLLLSDFNRTRILRTRALVLGWLLYGFFALDTVLSLRSMAATPHRSLPAILSYYAIGKAASIAAYLALCVGLAVLAKYSRSKAVALLVATTGYLLVTVTAALCVWHAGYQPGFQWSIGITNDYNVVNQYVNIVPLMIGPARPRLLDTSITFLPVAVNVALTAFLALGARFLIDRQRADFIPR